MALAPLGSKEVIQGIRGDPHSDPGRDPVGIRRDPRGPMDLDDDRLELKRLAELSTMDLDTYDRLERARIRELVCRLNFEYPEDIPEMADMTAWGARIFRTQREELLSEWAWDLVTGSLEITRFDVAKIVRDRWLRSFLRHTWSRGHREDRARETGDPWPPI